jgi:hypothetical protein
MAISHTQRADYLAAQSTLNRIHASAMEATKTDEHMQPINHHMLTAKFHLQEMERAQFHGMNEHHELAHDAFKNNVSEAGRYLHYVNTPHTDQLSHELDRLYLDSNALKFKE